IQKRDIVNPRHFRNSSAAADIDVNLAGFENLTTNSNTIRRLKAGMALNDRTILQSSQPFFDSFVRASRDRILARFYTLHINSHVAGGEPVSAAAPGYMGALGACNHRLCGDTARVHAVPAKFVAFDDSDRLSPSRKPRRQGRACLAGPDDDCVEVLHAASAPSILSLPSWAAS